MQRDRPEMSKHLLYIAASALMMSHPNITWHARFIHPPPLHSQLFLFSQIRYLHPPPPYLIRRRIQLGESLFSGVV